MQADIIMRVSYLVSGCSNMSLHQLCHIALLAFLWTISFNVGYLHIGLISTWLSLAGLDISIVCLGSMIKLFFHSAILSTPSRASI